MTHRFPDRRIALFPGSFNPFTIGHMSVLERGLALFDKVIVAIGINSAKPGSDTERSRRLEEVTHAVGRFGERVEVIAYSGLTVDEARNHGARFLLRGVRSVADFEYERNIADVNRRIAPEIETVLLYALPELSSVSSSVVRELQQFGHDASQFLP